MTLKDIASVAALVGCLMAAGAVEKANQEPDGPPPAGATATDPLDLPFCDEDGVATGPACQWIDDGRVVITTVTDAGVTHSYPDGTQLTEED